MEKYFKISKIGFLKKCEKDKITIIKDKALIILCIIKI